MKVAKPARGEWLLPSLALGASLGGVALALFAKRLWGDQNRSASSLRPGKLAGKVQELPGTEHVHVRDLGGGIVEAYGEAPDVEAAQSVLALLRSEPGVCVVVNRVWTPGSAGTPAELTPGPRAALVVGPN